MKRATLFLLLSLTLIIAAAAGGCGPDKDASANKPEATPTPDLPADVKDVAAVATPAPSDTPAPGQTGTGANVSEGNSDNNTVNATGELVSPVTSEVAVRTPGRVGKVFVDEGDRVRRGQPLLTLETQYLALDLKRADAEVARARAMAADAERDFKRKEDLVAKGSVARAAYDRSQSNYQAAQAGVASAEAERDLARQKLADAVLHSPINGVVAERKAAAGERMGDATVAFVLVQTSPLKLRFQLPERYLARVRRGQAVRATVDPYPGETFTGRVSVIGGVVDPQTRTVAVETEFPNSDGRLSPGLFARVEIDLGPSVEG
ncbi:MAG TPA: efflux RND transporter periplasmic adaptor subunit [Thermoanaerobaculia bacterium]|jgi:membrane fusion protein (multidrug efflux system)|nr:efflux RND transporter periplasmic adaptor subunit [Thermoanaerobaculia bacterium]